MRLRRGLGRRSTALALDGHVAQHQVLPSTHTVLSICMQQHFHGEPDSRPKKGGRKEMLVRTR